MAQTVLASGFKTILDLTDGGVLSAYLTCNLPMSQTYDTNEQTYSPDWHTTNLKITPNVFLDQTALSLDDSNLTLTWQRREGSGTPTALDPTKGETVPSSGDDKNKLVVGENNLAGLSSGMLTYILTARYQNSTTSTDITVKTEVTFTLTRSGTDAHSIYISGEQVFKTDAQGNTNPLSITLTAVTQPQSVTVSKWQYKNSGGTWTDYPTSTDNPSITGTTLVVKPGHSTFVNNVLSLQVLTSDNNIIGTFSVYKVSDGTSGTSGDDASIAFLSNDNITFAGDVDGKVSSVTKVVNVIAYTGTTKVTPTVGTITGAPTGMTVTAGTVSNNEIPISIVIANNATLGGAGQQQGVLSVPVTYPVSTTLQIQWSKVNTGQSAYLLTVYAPKGTIFNNGVVDGGTSLTLNAQFYFGSTDLTDHNNSYYLWQKYVNNAWVNVGSETAGSSGKTLTINYSDVSSVAVMNYRCRARYGGNSSTGPFFYDTITVTNKTDNYQATIDSTAGDVFQSGEGESILISRVWQAGVEVDPLKSTTFSATAPSSPTTGTYYYKINTGTPVTQVMRYSGTAWVDVTSDATYGHKYTYTWYRFDSDGNPLDTVTPFATGKVIHVTGDDVDGLTTFQCQVGTVAVAQFTIRDDTDIIVSVNTPTDPVLNMLWLDTGVTPNVLKKYNGLTWQVVNDTSSIYETISTSINTATTEILGTVEEKIAEVRMTDRDFTVMYGRTVGQGVTNEINGVQNNLDEYERGVSNYMRFDETGTLTLGKTDNNFRTQLTNTKMSFLEGESEVAYISNQSLFITTARITDTLSLGTNNGYGYFDWTITSTGLGLKWRDPGFGGIKVTMIFVGITTVPANFQITNDYNNTVFTAQNAEAGDGINVPFEWTISGIPERTAVTFTQASVDVSGYTRTGSSLTITSDTTLTDIVITTSFTNVYTAET